MLFGVEKVPKTIRILAPKPNTEPLLGNLGKMSREADYGTVQLGERRDFLVYWIHCISLVFGNPMVAKGVAIHVGAK
jgi:hypothetical protein